MIEVRDLVKAYGFRDARVVLDHVNLTVPDGCVFGVLGPIGAGKTTLLRILATALLPTSGEVTVGGFFLPREAKKARRVLALVPERSYFASWDNGWDYLRFWSRMVGLSTRDAKERIAEVAAFLDLGDVRDLTLQGLTVGMETRLNLGQALLSDPDLLFLDEPLTGAHPTDQKSLVDRLKRLQSRGKTVVLTSPHVKDVRAVCDWVAVVEAGLILRTLKTPDLLALIGRGRHARIFVETGSPTAALDAVSSLEGVVSSKAARDVVVLYVNPGVLGESQVRDALTSAGVETKSVRQAEIALGDVFRALHEGGES